MAVKIARRIEPTSEQLAASVILTGASALRMMRAERRQMGYISWRDLDPDEERRVLHASSPSAEDIYLPDLVRIGAVSGEVQEDLCLLVGLQSSVAACLVQAGPFVLQDCRLVRFWRWSRGCTACLPRPSA